MNRTKLSTNPADWLKAAPNPHSPADVAQVLASFASPPTLYSFTGPAEFIRGTGKDAKGRQARAYGGGYWVNAEVISKIDAGLAHFIGWISAKQLQQMKQGRYRAGSAVCDDWNDFAEFHKMVVPGGETIEGLAGPIKEQPLNSGMALGPTTPMLKGGFEQVYFRVKNPLWIFETKLF